MPGPLEAAGAVKNPSKYAGLGMGARQFTGLVTQRSPYRDGAVPYLVGKFYGGTRFDTIIDGINREISQRLTDVRRPGSAVYNSNDFPGILSFYAWKYIQNNLEVIKVLADGSDNNVYDATTGQKSTMYAKSGSGAEGPSYFLGINTELFIADNLNQKKILQGSQTWLANTAILPGTLINEGANPGTLQMALGGITMSIVATECVVSGGTKTVYIYTDQTSVPDQFPNLTDIAVSFSGLDVANFLNGQTLVVTQIISTTLGVFAVEDSSATAQPLTADTGSATTGDGISGVTEPAFSGTRFSVTEDSGQKWKCYGSALQNWTPAAPVKAPTLQSANGARFWSPATSLSFQYAILDTNGDIEIALSSTASSGGNFITGRFYPRWSTGSIATFNQTVDGTIIWFNYGPVGTWAASTTFGDIPSETGVILDSNQNLQYVSNNAGGTSGGSDPTWATAIGATTTDGTLTWTCLGPGVEIASSSVQYAYSYHGVDGSVSTASPPATIQGGILGPAQAEDVVSSGYLTISGIISQDAQVDQEWIWRTPIGQATLILEDQIPSDIPGGGATFTYTEYGIPDTSTLGQGALNPFIAAPVDEVNDPPPIGMKAMTYYQERIWGIYENMVVHSGGPDTIVGNGNTAFAPLDEIPFAAQPIRLIPVLVQDGGLIVMTTSGIKIILGSGTSTDPYFVGDYLELVSIASYNAVSVAYNQIFCMESNQKVSSIAIEYPFNPQTGYTELGFPIGDQFVQTTTGGLNLSFRAATSYVTWNMNSSADSGMYVSDGIGHWFRMSIINAPESGFLWSPIAALASGDDASAIQSVETTPGVHNLLIGSGGSGGPILMRDTSGTIWTDNGTPYPSWDAKGVTLLCGTGEWADVAHISTKSRAVGARPTVSVLFNEIGPVQPTSASGPNASYTALTLDEKSQNPTRGRRSVSVYSDRYDLAQNGVETEGDCLLTKFDYGTQAVGDELYDFGIYASVHDEREEQEAKS